MTNPPDVSKDSQAEVEGGELRGTKVPASEGGALESHHFWVSAFPFFESSLFVVPPLVRKVENASADGSAEIGSVKPATIEAQLYFFDADGALANETRFEVASSSGTVFELDQFMGSCKLEAGLKHAHLVVKLPKGSGVACRIHTRESGAIIGEPLRLSASRVGFFPLTLARERSNFITLINYGLEESTVRCRLVLGKRSPEVVWSVPPYGSRIVGIEDEFADYVDLKDQGLQGYVRLSSRSGNVGVQHLERGDGPKDCGIFSSVS